MTRSAKIERELWTSPGRPRCALGILGLLAMTGMTGCHHRRVQPVLLPPQTPVALVQVPEPDAPLVPTPTPKLPAIPIAHSESRPKKVKKPAPKVAAATSPQQPALPSARLTQKPADTAASPSVKPDAVAAIGALTVGGEQNPRSLQEANELLTANERRLDGISGEVAKAQAELVGKVRNFQKDAQVALASGDAEGAKTLATKGKLLLDDLDKGDAK